MSGIVKILVGSKAFFNGMEGFNPKDEDYVLILKTTPKNKKYQHARFGNRDYFIYKKMSKIEFIDLLIHTNMPMLASMFLVPEFIEYMDVKLDDLDLLQNVFEHIDDLHTYAKMIYDYYRKNKGFYLTEKQLEAVYMDYKKKRESLS